MNKSSFLHGSSILVEIEVNTNQVQILAGGVIPRLMIPVNLLFHPPALRSLSETDVTYTLLTGSFFLANVPDGEIFLGAIEPLQINEFHSCKWLEDRTRPHQIVVPLSYQALDCIEKHRATDVSFSLDLKLGGLLFGPAHYSVGRDASEPHRLSDALCLSSRLTLPIPQSTWIEQVVNRSDLGKVRIMELYLGTASELPLVAHSLKALETAERHLKHGNYNDAVMHCRVALEPFFENDKNEQKPGTPHVLKKSWETKLGNATYTWLDSMLGTLKRSSNPTHHSPIDRFDRLDAQMLVAITASVLSYATRQLSMDEKAV